MFMQNEMVSLMKFIVLVFQVRSELVCHNSHRGGKLFSNWTKLMLMAKLRFKARIAQ